MIRPVLTLVLASICLLASMASADDVQRLYVLDCGPNLGRDQARWSPGVNEGQAIEFSDNCYLIRHAKGLLLWDTGVPDAVATMPDGMVVANGAVTLLSTPGHTPGHQSLLVRLPKTGSVVLSGDAVHFRDNWEHRRVPSMNTDRAQTLASLQRLQSVLDERRAQLWINHDKAQSEGLRYAPAYYE